MISTTACLLLSPFIYQTTSEQSNFPYYFMCFLQRLIAPTRMAVSEGNNPYDACVETFASGTYVEPFEGTEEFMGAKMP